MTDKETEYLRNVMVSLDAGQYVSSDELRRVISILIYKAIYVEPEHKPATRDG